MFNFGIFRDQAIKYFVRKLSKYCIDFQYFLMIIDPPSLVIEMFYIIKYRLYDKCKKYIFYSLVVNFVNFVI